MDLEQIVSEAGVPTLTGVGERGFPYYVNEFWTAKQRQASPLHEVSYRACYKPQLPRFFIQGFSRPGDVVYDPFSGRGTTVLEAGLMGRNIVANDVNPLSRILAEPRFKIPDISLVEKRLSHALSSGIVGEADIDLSMFYHIDTLRELCSLREYLSLSREAGIEDDVDRWIRMVATNRLTGHSPGFFSVYTLPPNQAVSPQRQVQINQKRGQVPEYRNVKALILKKSRALLRGITASEQVQLRRAGERALFLSADARSTQAIQPESVALTVTSPPFLDVVQYAQDNWLRCWFNKIDTQAVAKQITMARTVDQWAEIMGEVFRELFRITKPGGHVAFEVGEVRKGTVKLEDAVIPVGLRAGFKCLGVLINQQEFTKTANIWGISNNSRGTNSNRIVLFTREEQ